MNNVVKTIFWLTLLTAAWLSLSAPAVAIVTADSAGTHVTNPGEPFSRQNSPPLNVDGVVQIVTETIRPFTGDTFEFLGTGALISDRHVLTAAHLLAVYDPIVGSIAQQIDMFGSDNKIRFNLPDGEHFIPIAGVALHPNYYHPLFSGNDIAIIELADDAPAAAPRYSIYSGSDEAPQPFVKVGYGEAGWGNSTQRNMDGKKRAGFNRYESDETYWATAYSQLGLQGIPSLPEGTGLVYDFDSGFPQHDALGFIGIAGLHFGADEVFPSIGDSGSPGFVYDIVAAGYKVAGVTSFSTSVLTDANYPVNDSTFGETAIDTRVSAFTSFIQDVVSGTDPTLKARVLNDGGSWVAEGIGALNHHALRITDSSSGTATALEVKQGATIGTERLLPGVFGAEIFDNSAVIVSGGVLEGYFPVVVAHDSATFELNSGIVRNLSDAWPTISLQDSSIGIIRGGTVEQAQVGVELYQNAQLTVAGGSITGQLTGVRIFDGATLTVSFGSITGDNVAGIGIEPGATALVSISGGTISGGMHDLINLSAESTIRIVGREGAFNLPLGEVDDESGTISGLFADGTPFNFSFFRAGGGVIELVAASGDIPGDYNHDGTVDAADYVVWRDGLGTAYMPSDYGVWRANYGRTAAAGASSLIAPMSSVPEPCTLVIFATGILCLATVRRRLEVVHVSASGVTNHCRRLPQFRNAKCGILDT